MPNILLASFIAFVAFVAFVGVMNCKQVTSPQWPPETFNATSLIVSCAELSFGAVAFLAFFAPFITFMAFGMVMI